MIFSTILLIIIIAVIIFLCISFYITIFGGGPFIPTPFPAVHEVLKHAKIKKHDKVYDIGAGDGRFIHFAIKDYQAQAVGFELDPFVFFLAKLRQWFWGWKGKIIRGNFLKHNVSDADIVLCYMLPRTLAKFQNKFDKELRKGTRVVSYAFHIGSWKPKKIIPKKGKLSKIWIYEV
jgi:SAM-dependent methyltransferase